MLSRENQPRPIEVGVFLPGEDKIKTLYRLDEQECKTLSMTYKKPQIYMNSVAAIALCRNGSIMVIHNPMNYDFSKG